jgi:hypothetical protein
MTNAATAEKVAVFAVNRQWRRSLSESLVE